MKSASYRIVVVVLASFVSMAALHAQEGGFLDLLGLGDADAAEVMEEFADPEDIMCWVELPRQAKRGDEITLKVLVENGRSEKVLRLSHVDIEDTFMKGFKVLSVAPEPRQQDQLFGILTLEFPDDLNAGETSTYEIRLQAKTPGVYIGDVDIYEGQRWLTRAAQIRITE